MNGTNYEVPHCGAFSTPHSHPSWAQIFASGSCFHIPLACAPPLMKAWAWVRNCEISSICFQMSPGILPTELSSPTCCAKWGPCSCILFSCCIHSESFSSSLNASTTSPCSLQVSTSHVGLGGLGVTCSPRDTMFAGSNPTEVDGFFRT